MDVKCRERRVFFIIRIRKSKFSGEKRKYISLFSRGNQGIIQHKNIFFFDGFNKKKPFKYVFSWVSEKVLTQHLRSYENWIFGTKNIHNENSWTQNSWTFFFLGHPPGAVLRMGSVLRLLGRWGSPTPTPICILGHTSHALTPFSRRMRAEMRAVKLRNWETLYLRVIPLSPPAPLPPHCIVNVGHASHAPALIPNSRKNEDGRRFPYWSRWSSSTATSDLLD